MMKIPLGSHIVNEISISHFKDKIYFATNHTYYILIILFFRINLWKLQLNFPFGN